MKWLNKSCRLSHLYFLSSLHFLYISMQVIIQDSDFLHPKKYWYKTNLLLIHQFMIKDYIYRHHLMMIKEEFSNHLVGAPIVKI
jgi:hypothetical protein